MARSRTVREFGFELRLCAHLETDGDRIVARQLGGAVPGTTGRILDVVTVEPGPAFSDRREITEATIPPRAIHSAVGVGQARRWPVDPDLHPEAAERILEEAVDVGFFERTRRDGADYVRQAVRYPAWFGEITAIENKPDLSEPGALRAQLRRDVALGAVDRVILATASHVTGAHLNRLPDEVGVWEVDVDGQRLSIEAVREPASLSTEEWGLAVGERHPVSREVRPVSPAEKAKLRVRIAERAYGTGWRPAFPACSQVERGSAAGSDTLPFCTWKDRVVNPGGCGPSCPGYDEAPPPPIDPEAERARHTPWDPDPPGVSREQASLQAFSGREER